MLIKDLFMSNLICFQSVRFIPSVVVFAPTTTPERFISRYKHFSVLNRDNRFHFLNNRFAPHAIHQYQDSLYLENIILISIYVL